MKLIEYEKFKKQNKVIFTSWIRNELIDDKHNKYNIKFIKVGRNVYPYVEVLDDNEGEIEPVPEFKIDIDSIIETLVENKNELKNVEYLGKTINDPSYYVIGIGWDAIKAYRNNEPEPKFFRYKSKRDNEGLRLALRLFKTIEQQTLV